MMRKKGTRRLGGLLATVMLLTVTILVGSAFAEEGRATVDFRGVEYELSYAGVNIDEDGLVITVECDSLPIYNGKVAVPAVAVADTGKERVEPETVSVSIVENKVHFDFRFAQKSPPQAVWLYPDGNQDKAILLWGTPSAAEKKPEEQNRYGGFRVVTFGHYEQDNRPENGPEPIQWLVLEEDGETALLISKQVLDAMPYYQVHHSSTTWEASFLRQWLNGEFANAAFTEEEQGKMALFHSKAETNPKYGNDPGNDTFERVALLSAGEAEAFFSSDTARVCARTDYARARGANTSTGSTMGQWWLRTLGKDRDDAAIVSSDGSVYLIGTDMVSDKIGIRPVIRLRLSETPASGKAGPAAEDFPLRGIVNYGRYEQDLNSENGPEPIQWMVLANDGEKVTLISLAALDNGPYHSELADVTWETCALRGWLNHDFLNTAFSEEEQAALAETAVTAESNPKHPKVDPGQDTVDRVFILSLSEAQSLFVSNGARACIPTRYAVASGVSDYNGSRKCDWMLRTPGRSARYCLQVRYGGSTDAKSEETVTYPYLAVRPVIVVRFAQNR